MKRKGAGTVERQKSQVDVMEHVSGGVHFYRRDPIARADHRPARRAGGHGAPKRRKSDR